MNLFDQIWPRVVKVAAFILGMWIMYHEAFIDHSDRPYLYAAAIAMMGLQIAETIEKFAVGIGAKKGEPETQIAQHVGADKKDQP